MSKRRIKLPPLVLDGEAKVLHKMNLRELHLCLTRALRAVGGDSVEESGRSVFSVMDQPPWWPQELPFDAKFTQKLPPEERSVYYRHLLSACYSYYKQEDTLHLFDSRPGEPPRWRLIQDGDEYTIVSTYTERPIWSYSSNYQILPLITLAARQAEQYRATIGERLKRSKSDKIDLVIRTRSQKANPQTNVSLLAGLEIGDEDDDGGMPMSPRSQQVLSPDGSPRRISILNRVTLSNRISVAEMCAEQPPDAALSTPPAEVRCSKCGQGFPSRSRFMEHLLQEHQEPNENQDMKKHVDLFRGVKLAPRPVLDDYKQSVRHFVPKSIPVLKFWKPQFFGCQLPLSSELGRRLFGAEKVQVPEERGQQLVAEYEKYCGTRPKGTQSTDQEKTKEDGENKVKETEVDSENPMEQQQQKCENDEGANDTIPKESFSGNGTPEKVERKATAKYAKFYPVIYRPPRLIFHHHTYKFTRAQRQMYIRMQKNGGLNSTARKLLENCTPISVNITRITEEDLAAYGIILDDSDEEYSSEGYVRLAKENPPRTTKKRKGRSEASLTQIVTRSHVQQASSAARALSMVRKKYWGKNAHLVKRIGGLTENQGVTQKHKGGRRRRSRRGHQPRRRFSLVEEFDGVQQVDEGEGTGFRSLPTSPLKFGINGKMGKNKQLLSTKVKPFWMLSKTGSVTRGRPRREHRLPVRYRSPDKSDDEHGNSKKRRKKQLLTGATTAPSPSKLFVAMSSPLKSAVLKREFNLCSGPPLGLSVTSKSGKEPTSATAMISRKTQIRPLSVILPKDAKSLEAIKPKGPELHAPPPYAMLTAEHVYANLGDRFAFSVNEPILPPVKGFGRFMAPRPLSPATEERIRETINEVVEAACGDLDYSLPVEVNGLAHYGGDAKVGYNNREFIVIKRDVDEEEEPSRCSSESTIVSAIFEVPSSPDGEDKANSTESKWRVQSPPSHSYKVAQHMEEGPCEDVPAAKRLKMSFSEICASPQEIWPRPSILAGRKPAILGGRAALPVLIRTNRGSATNGTAGNQADTVNNSSSAGMETKVSDIKQEQGAMECALAQQHTKVGSCQIQSSAPIPATTVRPVASGPVIIIPSSTTTALATSAPMAQQQIPLSNLVGKAIRMPTGCRLVAIPMKNVAQQAQGAVFRPTATPTVSMMAGSTSITSFQPRVVAVQGNGPGTIPAVYSITSQLGASTSATTASHPSQASQNVIGSNTSFKCGFCGVELLFATNKAWQNIQYHMSVAHQNRNYKLRKVIKKRASSTVVIEAVSV